ncbi:EamA/RhaT family transporter [Kitasatospora camelliae]|uniref:EamA/RhaT family transporter n=1 Tax=Kitasatospora camelliae TaxID=3156397 RepID=A0AAU8JWB9_9ACTN
MDDRNTPTPQPAGAPRPEPIRWFGTSWVEHDDGYWARRVLVALGALAATAAGALVLRFAVSGVQLSDAGGLVDGLLIAAIGICTCLAAVRTWKLLSEGRDSLSGWMAEERSLGAVWLIGFAGALAAYFLRSLTEAPGEAVHRAAYRAATERYERRGGGGPGLGTRRRRG